jgi:hypothetical protein
VAPLCPPDDGEREPVYTARCLRPPVRDLLHELQIQGLVHAGDGGSRARPVGRFGLRFYPDLSITYHGSLAIAIEVKYLGASGRENAIATALGQTWLYRQAAYQRAALVVVDLVGVMSDRDIQAAEDLCRRDGIQLVVRRKIRNVLLVHPGQ